MYSLASSVVNNSALKSISDIALMLARHWRTFSASYAFSGKKKNAKKIQIQGPEGSATAWEFIVILLTPTSMPMMLCHAQVSQPYCQASLVIVGKEQFGLVLQLEA